MSWVPADVPTRRGDWVPDERPWHAAYPEGIPPRLEYPVMPLHRFLDRTAERFGDRTATIFVNGRLTYRELRERADRFAAALAGLGIAKGDRVALMLPNCPQFVIAYYGVLKAGGVVVPTNPLYVERELEHQLKDSGARALVTLDMFYPTVAAVQPRTGVEHVILSRVSDALAFPLNLLYPLKQKREGQAVAIPPGANVLWFSDLLKQYAARPPEVEVDPEADVAVLGYTGGTTGVPKGAMLTHFNLVANVVQCRAWNPDLEDGTEVVLTVLPLFHSYAMTVCMNLGVASGGTLVLIPRPVLDDVLRAIDRHRPTQFPGVPTLYVAINNHPDIAKYDLSSIRTCLSGAAALPREVQERFEERSGGRLVEGYGLTETSPVTHANPIRGTGRIGTIGLAYPDTDCRIVDVEAGETDCAPGEPGELALRGPQVMKGYWSRAEESARALRDGWFFTGDICTMDPDGYFRVVDRKKDMIIASGFNIYPREVEEVLYAHPKVKEAAVIGVSDPYRGETVKAFIVLKDGEQASTEEFIEYCRSQLARYKVPKLVEFRDALPKSLIGKVLRRVLAEEEAARLREPAAGAGAGGGAGA